jgi:hypothetical protein
MQAVESFHSEIKRFIRNRKGVKTTTRELFLKEFCFLFNNRNNLFLDVLDLMKISEYIV